MITCYQVFCKKHVSISERFVTIVVLRWLWNDDGVRLLLKRRFSPYVHFKTESEKEVFIARLTSIRDLFSPEGGEKVYNYELLSQLFSLAETRPLSWPSQATVSPKSSCMTNILAANGEMFWKLLHYTCWNEMCSLRIKLYYYNTVGVYTGDTSADDQHLFVLECRAFVDVSGTGSSI